MNEFARAPLEKAVQQVADQLSQVLRPDAIDGEKVAADAGGLRYTLSIRVAPTGPEPEELPPRVYPSIRTVYLIAWKLLALSTREEITAADVVEAAQLQRATVEGSTVGHAMTDLVAFGYLRKGVRRGTYRLPDPTLF